MKAFDRGVLMLALMLACLAGSGEAAGPRGGGGPRVMVTIAGDLSQGAALRAMAPVIPGGPGVLLRRSWFSGEPSMTLPGGQIAYAGGLPVMLRLEATVAPRQEVKLVETPSQRRAFGLLGLQSVFTMKRYAFERLAPRR